MINLVLGGRNRLFWRFYNHLRMLQISIDDLSLKSSIELVTNQFNLLTIKLLITS